MDSERRRRPRRRSHWDGVLGMNARNALLASLNPPSAVRLVNSKYQTKLALIELDIPAAPTLGVADDLTGMRALIEALPDAWAIKPDRGRAGGGILIARSRDAGFWHSPGGKRFSEGDVLEHGRLLLEGVHSMGNVEHDLVLAEPLLVAHHVLAEYSPAGLPDIRVIVHRGHVLAAMLRLATIEGDGKANLHQGGIGVAIDLDTGRTVRAVRHGHPILEHPDSGRTFDGVIPHWERVMDISRHCADATKLGYFGADIVIDRELGPLVIEVNAHPGLEIQNVCRAPLGHFVKRDHTKLQPARS